MTQPVGFPTEEILISHSEVDTYLLCKQRHYYAFGDLGGRGLEPKKLSTPLYKGTTGHKAIELFWLAIKEGSSVKEAAAAGMQSLYDAGVQPGADLEVINTLAAETLPTYFEVFAPALIEQGYRPVEVENTRKLVIPDKDYTLVYPFTPDLVMQFPDKSVGVVDHKFIYNFYNQSDISTMGQIPKYIAALRALGVRVEHGVYNMLRTRPVGKLTLDQRYRMTKFTPTLKNVTTAFLIQVRHMREIARLKSMPNAQWKEEVATQRVLNNMICKSCSFKELCSIELNGGNGELTRKVEYSPNSYGYKPEMDSIT